ncbi:MAG: Ku protein [Gammaproteobacteria bacterium]
MARKRKSQADAAKSVREQPVGGRPLWSGQIRLSLVSVPVQIHAAVNSGARLSFHQVHAPSGKRIRYEKIAPGIGPVPATEILKGYEISDGQYVLLEQAEIDSVKLSAKHIFELVQFVEQGAIDLLYFDRPYYVTPQNELAEDGYRVLRDALRETRKVGIGQIVMRSREYIAALKPCGRGLLMETLRFDDEVRRAAPLFAPVDEGGSDGELVALARELIERKSAPFDPATFRDRYSEALRALVEDKVKHRRAVSVDEDEAPDGAEVIDLVAALRRSLGGSGKPTPARPRRKARRAR